MGSLNSRNCLSTTNYGPWGAGSRREELIMGYLNIVIRNLLRNSTRSVLTLLSTAFSMFVISTLVAFSGSADRVTTRTASSVRIAESDRLLEAGSFGNDLGASPETEAYSHE